MKNIGDLIFIKNIGKSVTDYFYINMIDDAKFYIKFYSCYNFSFQIHEIAIYIWVQGVIQNWTDIYMKYIYANFIFKIY